ncbi:hypothetical protein [Natrinema pallidum]|uniref:Uncharacterized protein n=1 Tax=Natrinema pallidum DSM 3751 TaxID=1227495 RepID=L9YJV3_9EURY|nr:hypothetical protein [Natrinema pallidum]ELY73213.1 hypothetical protein C487_17465 [Natrinema pallidum DSM 3751]
MPDADLVTERDLARTYDPPSYADAYDAVQDYRRVLAYHSRHPDKGSSAIASALELPRGRVRPWLDGAAPDAVNAIDTARSYGWLGAEYDDPEFRALNTLVANVFSGGSITEQHYQPSFALAEDSHVTDALERAGVEYQLVTDRDGRADEARPTDDGTVLGRVLAVLGAPAGPKAGQRLALPTYLERAPDAVRTQFVGAYLANRAVAHQGKATLTVREDRNRTYLESLAALCDDVAGGGVALRERDIVISADAARALGFGRVETA